VVPIVVYGAREVMRKGSFTVRPATVHVHLLEPVPTTGYDYDHRHDLVRTVWGRMADLLRDEYGVVSAAEPVASSATTPSSSARPIAS
jgi:1-acyl-sn-glycerol-3-phosphate acyltransferase